nr:MAG: RNA-dependent RNA polymerase [Drosophila Hillwood park negevirus]
MECTDVIKSSVLAKLVRNEIKKGIPETAIENGAYAIARRLMASDSVPQILYQDLLAKTNSEVSGKQGLRKISVKERLDETQQEMLSEMFCNFNIDFSKGYDSSGHCFARCLRKLTEIYCFERLHYCDTQISGNNYDVALKDVGGNPWSHAISARVNVHSCCPLIDHNDVTRSVRYRQHLMYAFDKFKDYTYDLQRSLKLHIEKDSRVVCNNVSQLCRVKSPRLIFNHSAYDMTVYEMAESMAMSNAYHAVGAIHYAPMVLTNIKGKFSKIGMMFKKYVKNGRTRIRFWFENDTQLSYDHDFDVYISHLKPFRVSIKYNGRHEAFSYDIILFSCDTIIFEMRKLDSGFTPGGVCSRILTDDSMNDKCFITFYSWNTLTNASFFPSLKHMRKEKLIVPIRLFELLMAYAASVTSAKFLIKNLQIAAQTMNSRQIINGASIVSPDKMSASDVDKLAHLVFVLQYINNYENSQMVSHYLKQEESVRSFGDANIFSRLWYNISNKFLNREIVGYSYEIEKNKYFTLCPENPSANPDVQKFSNLFKIARSKNINVETLFPKFSSFEEELENISLSFDELYRGFDTVSFYTYPENITDDDEEEVETTYNHIKFETDFCSVKTDVVTNESNGHCLLQSFFDAKLIKGKAHAKFLCNKAMLRVTIDDKDKVVNYLNNDLMTIALSADLWPPNTLALLLAQSLSVNICLHVNSSEVLKFSVGENSLTYHFSINNGHMQYLKVSDDLPECFCADPKVVLNNAYDWKSRVKSYELHFNKMRNDISITEFKRRYLKARFNSDPYSSLMTCGYICRSALKSAEILHRFFNKECLESAVSFGGPGGEVQVLHDTTAAYVFGITLVSENNFTLEIDEQRFLQLYGTDLSGDVLNVDNRHNMIQEITQSVHRDVSFFGGDLCLKSNNVDFDDESLDNHLELLKAQWHIISSVLVEGGGGYFKMFNCTRVGETLFIEELMSSFEELYIVKLLTTRPVSSEFHVICLGFKVVPEALKFKYDLALCTIQRDIDRNCVKSMTKLYSHFTRDIESHNQDVKEIERMRMILGQRPKGNKCGGIYSKIFGSPQKLKPFDEYRLNKCLNFCKLKSDVQIVQLPISLPIDTFGETTLDEPNFVSSTPADVSISSSNNSNSNDNSFSDESISSVNDNDELQISLCNNSSAVMCNRNRFGRFMCRSTIKRALFRKLFGIKSKLVNFNKSSYNVCDSDTEGIFPNCKRTTVDKKPDSGFMEDLSKRSEPVVEKIVDIIDESLDSNYVVVDVPNTTDDNFNNKLSDVLQVNPTMQAFSPVDKFNLNFVTESVAEYKNILVTTHNSEISNLRYYRDKLMIVPNVKDLGAKANCDFGVIDPITLNFKIKPKQPLNTYLKCLFNDEFRNFPDKSENLSPNDVIIVSEYCAFGFDREIFNNIKDLDLNFKFLSIGLIQAGPGCGKTFDIINEHKPTDSMVILSTVEGRQDFIRRAELKYGKINDAEMRYRTLASVLMNPRSLIKFQRLFIDEALMNHCGAIFSAIGILNPEHVFLYGDSQQIPFVNRCRKVDCKFYNIADCVDVTRTLNVSYRIPCDIAFRFKNEYETGLKAISVNTNSAKIIKISNIANVPIKKNVQYLCFTQSEKNLLLQKSIDVSTIHEFQGKEADVVYVVRLNHFAQEEIFLRKSYALVALTRHKREMRYYTMVTTDALAKLVLVDGILYHRIATPEKILKECYHNIVGGVVARMNYGSFPTSELEEKSSVFVNVKNLTPDVIIMKPNLSNKIQWNANTIKLGVKSLKFDSLKNFVNALCQMRVSPQFIGKRKFAIYERDIIGVSLPMISQKCYKYLGKNIDFKIITKVFVKSVEPEVYDMMTKHAFISGVDYEDEIVSVDICKEPELSFDVSLEISIEHMQFVLDHIFGSMNYIYQQLDEVLINFDDFEIVTSDVSFVPTKAIYKFPEFDTMQSKLESIIPCDRNYNFRELMLALNKRNKNVPNITGTVDIPDQALTMLNSFIDTFTTGHTVFQTFYLTNEKIQEWLFTQNLPNLELIVPEYSIDQSPLNEYKFAIKRRPKPNLTFEATDNYAALQTIVHHPKYVNAIFCVLFKELRKRVMSVLKDNFKIMTDMSVEDFSDVLTNIGDKPFAIFAGDDSLIFDGIEYLEVDISKYDKSQGLLALQYECLWMTYFGAPKFLVDLWFNAHVITTLNDPTSGIRSTVAFQRKSGDASTFFGNTMFLMGVLNDVLKLNELSCGFVESIRMHKNLTENFAMLYNLESKIYSFRYPMFCSKFFVKIRDRWVIVPDPIKLLVKFARSDLINPTHVECYKISVADNVKSLKDYSVCEYVGRAIAERYKTDLNFSLILNGIPKFVDDHFSDIFYIENGAKIDFSRLDFDFS